MVGGGPIGGAIAGGPVQGPSNNSGGDSLGVGTKISKSQTRDLNAMLSGIEHFTLPPSENDFKLSMTLDDALQYFEKKSNVSNIESIENLMEEIIDIESDNATVNSNVDLLTEVYNQLYTENRLTQLLPDNIGDEIKNSVMDFFGQLEVNMEIDRFIDNFQDDMQFTNLDAFLDNLEQKLDKVAGDEYLELFAELNLALDKLRFPSSEG